MIPSTRERETIPSQVEEQRRWRGEAKESKRERERERERVTVSPRERMIFKAASPFHLHEWIYLSTTHELSTCGQSTPQHTGSSVPIVTDASGIRSPSAGRL